LNINILNICGIGYGYGYGYVWIFLGFVLGQSTGQSADCYKCKADIIIRRKTYFDFFGFDVFLMI
jgi:hypothetical protein